MSSSTLCTSLEYVLGALHSPNGICLNCHRPQGVWKAVLGRSSALIDTA